MNTTEDFAFSVSNVKLNAKNARETLRVEIKKLGRQIKVLERDNPKGLSHSNKARKLNFLRRRATLVGMAIALYRNRIHSKCINLNHSKIEFKDIFVQVAYLMHASNFAPSSLFFGSKKYLNTTQTDCVKKILDWHNYKVNNPKPF